jgi:hypothetical protein
MRRSKLTGSLLGSPNLIAYEGLYVDSIQEPIDGPRTLTAGQLYDVAFVFVSPRDLGVRHIPMLGSLSSF